MQFPEELREAAEAYAQTFDRKTLIKAAETVSARYREGSADGSELVTKPEEVAAYAAVRMPATFAAVSNALEHALTHFAGTIKTAADIGAGTGAAGWAVAELTDGLSELHCFERVGAMRSLGERLMTEAGISADVFWHELDVTRGELPESYDLITACYIMNELTPDGMARAVRSLWEKTKGMLLIVEPGTKTGHANILKARGQLIDLGAQIAYPCPGNGACPLPEDDWCHFTARAARSKLHKQLKGGDVPYEDEKFSCIAAVRAGASPCRMRILRHPQIASGAVELHVCTAEGISDIMVTRSSKQFKAARKSDSGDAFGDK